MSDKQLIPSYVDADFDTIKARLKTLLSKVDNFQDYDFEGANITLLMELNAYVGDLQTFFTNRLAQNIHTETADQYEVVHSLVRQQGYEPTGYIGSELTLTITVNRVETDTNINFFEIDDQLHIPRGFRIDTGLTTDDGDPIYYTVTEAFTYDCTEADVVAGFCTFDIIPRQGDPIQQILEFTGEDIVANQIVLPFKNWDMGTYPYESGVPSIVVTVGENEIVWERISDFFDEISGLREVDNAYMLQFDKYERYILAFSLTRNVPTLDDTIKVYVIETLGADGVVAINTYDTLNGVGTKPVSSTILGVQDIPFIENITQTVTVPDTQYDLINTQPSAGGANPQSLDELKLAGKSAAHRQYRNVTKYDYIGTLEARSDVTVANAWGEQEQNPDTMITTNYNRAYLSLIPTEWDNDNDSNISLFNTPVGGTFANDYVDKSLDFPLAYNTTWTDQILEYIEPYKMLSIWEEFILPELVYFKLDIGLTVKRTYNFTTIQQTVKNKLIWYFSAVNREFGDEIDFREITKYVLDSNNVSPDDDFAAVRGINSLVIRDILTYRYMEEQDVTTTPIVASGTGLIVDYTHEGGVLTTITVGTTGGTLYVIGDTISVDAVNSGTGLQVSTSASAGVITSIDSIFIPGSGYNVGDVLRILVPNASGDATLRVDAVNGTGGVTAVSLIFGGTSGYVSWATAQASEGDAVITVTEVTDGTGAVISVEITDGGTGYAYTGTSLEEIKASTTPISASGTGFTVDYKQTSGVITTVTINTIGNSYTTSDTVSVDGGNDDSTITIDSVDVNGGITAITITGGGTGYTYTIDNLSIYDDNIVGDFPHFVELGYTENNVDTMYNTMEPIKLGFNQFPRLADEFLIFINEG
jgi:hypothetical protein